MKMRSPNITRIPQRSPTGGENFRQVVAPEATPVSESRLESPAVRERVALLAATESFARDAARRLAPDHRELHLVPCSVGAFLTETAGPGSVVVCPEGRRVTEDLTFLRKVRDRILWSAPPRELALAIAGVRAEEHSPEAAIRRGRPPRTALLLEGLVTAARAAAALRAKAPSFWIVEDARRVRLSQARLEKLERAGVRWMSLSPVRLLAVAAGPALLRARARWKGLLQRDTEIWTLDAGP
jgi:hypothetical protein